MNEASHQGHAARAPRDVPGNPAGDDSDPRSEPGASGPAAEDPGLAASGPAAENPGLAASGPGLAASGPGLAAEDLIGQIGAEIDRRLDARLAALGLTGTVTGGNAAPGLPAEAVPGASQPGDSKSPALQRSLWLGIMIGSAITGVAAVVQGARISNEVDAALSDSGGGSFDVLGVLFSALIIAWLVLFVIYVGHSVAGQARDRRR